MTDARRIELLKQALRAIDKKLRQWWDDKEQMGGDGELVLDAHELIISTIRRVEKP